jgi:hypothetical protein
VKELAICHNGTLQVVCYNLEISDAHGLMLAAFVEVCAMAYTAGQLSQRLVDADAGSACLRNVLEIAATASRHEGNRFVRLLEMVCDLIGMSAFAVFERTPTGERWSSVIERRNIVEGSFAADDPFFRHLRKPRDGYLPVDANLCPDSALVSLFTENFTKIVMADVWDRFSVVFAGNGLTLNFSELLVYFHPIMALFLRNHNMKLRPLESKVTIDVIRTKILDSDVSSRLFSVNRFSESEQLECVVKMFHNLDLVNALETDLQTFSAVVVAIRESYTGAAFHNWQHAVDTTQFVYSCVVRGRLKRYFRPVQIAALLLAALCHDIGHEGLSTAYHIKAESPLLCAFGPQSTLERYHAQLAAEILERSPLVNVVDTPAFWRMFVNCIVATDMSRHFEFVEMATPVVKKFSYADELHQFALAQLIIKCGNFANTVRPFDVAVRFAEALKKEYEYQAGEEQRIGVELTKFGEDDGMELWEIETAFYGAIVQPTLKLLAQFAPDLRDFLVQMEDNMKKWEEMGLRSSGARKK